MRIYSENNSTLVSYYDSTSSMRSNLSNSKHNRVQKPVAGVVTSVFITGSEQCSYNREYSCEIEYLPADGGMNKTIKRSVLRPGFIVPVQGGVDVLEPTNYELPENSDISFTRKGSVGRRSNGTAGRVLWQFKDHSRTITLAPDDKRVTSNITVSQNPNCSFESTSILTLTNVKRDMDGTEVVCYLFNEDINSTEPSDCLTSGDANSPCKTFSAIYFPYTLNKDNIIVTRKPRLPEIAIGTTVTMKCKYKDGNPKLTWERVGDENMTLHQEALSNGEVVISIHTELDNEYTENYHYRCVATKDSLNTTDSVSRTISFSVVSAVTIDDEVNSAALAIGATVFAVATFSLANKLLRKKPKLPEAPVENQENPISEKSVDNETTI